MSENYHIRAGLKSHSDYKMIARTVHNHTPEKQVTKTVFQRFVSNRKKVGKKRYIDIDALPVYA